MNNSEELPIKPPHDNLFRGALENPMVAEEFFRTHLPANVYSMIDKTTLQIENESFIEKDLQEKITDVLFSAKINGQESYIYTLLEHQSTPDPMMSYRMLKYMLCICDRHMKQYPEKKKLPLVYPMIIYNGRKKYNVARNIWDLFEHKDLAKQFWSDEDYKLINLQEIPD